MQVVWSSSRTLSLTPPLLCPLPNDVCTRVQIAQNATSFNRQQLKIIAQFMPLETIRELRSNDLPIRNPLYGVVLLENTRAESPMALCNCV